MVDGHVGLVLGGAATYFATINATMPKGWVRTFIHREPVVAGGIGERRRAEGRSERGLKRGNSKSCILTIFHSSLRSCSACWNRNDDAIDNHTRKEGAWVPDG